MARGSEPNTTGTAAPPAAEKPAEPPNGACGEGCTHEHAHSHEHSHAPSAAPAAGGERWLTSQQYKGIGKYLKPWGKPPTGTTFWIQIITTAAVIVISILKGVESTVAIVVSTGPAATVHAEQNPMVLASGICFGLFSLVLGAGYLLARRSAAAPPEVEAEEVVAAPKAKDGAPKEAKAKRREARSEEAQERQAIKSARLEAQLAEELKARDTDLAHRRQEVWAQAEAEGLSAADTQKRMWLVEQDHQERVALKERIHRVHEAAAKEGLSQEETHMRVNETIHMHEESRKMRQGQAKELRDLEQEAVKDGCLPAEVRRRVHSRKQAHAVELAAFETHREVITTVVQQCKAQNLKDEAIKQAVTQAKAKLTEDVHMKHRAWMMQEKKARALAAAALKESARYPPEVRNIMLSRVRIDGLKARPELNGRFGTVATYKAAADNKPGRLAVTVDGESAPVLLKMEALTVVGFDDQPLPMSEMTDEDGPPPLM